MRNRFLVSLVVITNPVFYNSHKRRALAAQALSLEDRYKILEGLYREARQLGRFNEQDFTAGLDDVVRLASLLNSNVSDAPR
jgi:hypothetical protein